MHSGFSRVRRAGAGLVAALAAVAAVSAAGAPARAAQPTAFSRPLTASAPARAFNPAPGAWGRTGLTWGTSPDAISFKTFEFTGNATGSTRDIAVGSDG